MQNTWIYQKEFALEYTDSLNLEEKKIAEYSFLQNYTVSKNLFDEDDYLERSILISELDENLVDDTSCQMYLQKLKHVKKLVILYDRPKNDSEIYSDFSWQILKAYIIFFESKGIHCFYAMKN